MKKIFLITFSCILFSMPMVAQSVGINNTTPHASAILDVKSNNKGVLIPRTSSTSRVAIVNPAKGLILYDTTTSGFWFHNGTAWSQLSVGNNAWNLTGNAATNPASNFIGTTDNQPLRFRVNNTWAGEIHPTSGNVFLGVGAGQSNTGGQINTAIGEHSLFTNTTGTSNGANGAYALNSNTTGNSNTANGSLALFFNTTGSDNTAGGDRALYDNTTGNKNTATGAQALGLNSTGDENTATGYRALFSNTTGTFNTATGVDALLTNSTGSYNTANGYQALYANITGVDNTAGGSTSLSLNTTGKENTAFGSGALYSNTTGDHNTATGFKALYTNSTGSDNTVSGYQALFNNNSFSNTADGYQALYTNVNGFRNDAHGFQSLYYNTSGESNVANGYRSLYFNSIGNNNTAIGYGALYNNLSGYRNTAVGFGALSDNKDGYNNIAIGFNSGTHPNAPNVYNTISIGNDDILNAYQNQVFIGNTSTAFIGGKVPWSVISDARVKNNIVEDVMGLSFILKLRPVTYHLSNDAITTISGSKKTPDFPGKYDGEKIKYSGFLAQEVEQAAKSVNYDFSGFAAPKNQWGLYTLSYEQFVVPLVKAVQEQQAIIDKQQKQLDILEKRLTALEAK